MTQEDRQLLYIDLCSRLPYGVNVKTTGDNESYTLLSINWNKNIALIGLNFGDVYATSKIKIDEVKPYLRPMSSMTEEEKHYIDNRWGADNYGDIITYSSYEGGVSTVELVDIIGFQDWLNAHHFDYRGLIEKGLAIEVMEKNNPYK